jgi:phosphinothricin acetyltransferase
MVAELAPVIDAMQLGDWAAVQAIYAEGIATGLATLEAAVPTWEHWNEAHLPICRLVARLEGQVVGWAALLPVSRRQVYAGVAEESVYIGAAVRGRGVGRRLLSALIDASEAAGFWTLQAVILRENAISIHLHERCGFRMVGFRERIGFARGKWHDTVLMERRSGSVGV